MRSNHPHRFIVTSLAAALVLLLNAGLSLADAPATSKELCQQKVAAYALPDQIRDSPTSAIRQVTPEDLAKLQRVLRSQCMLSADELNAQWEGKTETERAAFFSNYERVNRLVTDDIFSSIFPKRQSVYTRQSFLKSAMAFPALCGEDGQTDETCMREFAVMFAHWLQETSGLEFLTEGNCVNGGCQSYLDTNGYFYNAYVSRSAPEPDYQYWGRGPKQLSYNGNYGRFSWGYLGGTSQGDAWSFLERPSLLLDDAFIDQAFVSAFWFYMTPVSHKPSMHEVITGQWTPNSQDIAAGITAGFGATIDIINGAVECNKTPTQNSLNRIAFYKGGVAQNVQTPGTLTAFGLQPLPGEALNCENMQPFPADGAGSYPLYFNLNRWSQCELYVNESLFTVYDQTPLRALGNALCANGLDCCQKTQVKIKQEDKSDLPPLVINEYVAWMGGAPLNIQANGKDGTVTIHNGEPVTFSLSLEAGVKAGQAADWWLAARSIPDSLWYIFNATTKTWNKSSALAVSSQNKLSSLNPGETQITVASPAVGQYMVYFAVDGDANGRIDPDSLIWNKVKLVVLPN